MTSPGRPPNSERLAALRRACKQWRKDLIDASGRNPLRRFRDLRTGTLDLTPGGAPGLKPEGLDRLFAGDQVGLNALFGAEGDEPEAPNPFADAHRRLRAIHKRAQSDFEEKGIKTCFVAIGLARWEVTAGSEPIAPVVLIPLTIETRSATRQELTLTVSDGAHLNPVLTHILSAEYGIGTDDDEADVEDETPEDLAGLHALLARLEASWRALPALTIEPRVVIGIFRASTMPLVEDMEGGLELLAQNDLVAAIAGSEGARAALRSRICDPPRGQPDIDPPDEEFLVLDCDSSQHLAINRVLGGEPLVIQGPPGTGKSQTIANLIAALIARGKRVLFVAEKRGAIDAVTKRLRQVGLDDLVMDMHGGGLSRREFARSLGASLERVSKIPAQDHLSALHERLRDAREELNGNNEALHETREPWGLSVFEMRKQRLQCEQRLGDARAAVEQLRISREAAQNLDRDGFERLLSKIGDWVDLGGPTLSADHPEWAASGITTFEEARAAVDLVRTLDLDLLPAARNAVVRVLGDAGFAQPETVDEWRQALDVLGGVAKTLERCRPEVFALPHADLQAALAPARGSVVARLMAGLFSGAYKQAQATVRGVLREVGALSAADALTLVETAAAQVEAWEERGGVGEPRVPSGLADAGERSAALEGGLDELARVASLEGLRRRSHAELATQLQRLAASPTIAATLPSLHELEAAFEQAGVASILGRVGAEIPPGHAANAVKHAWLRRVLRDIEFEDQRLFAFNSDVHSRRCEEFAEADRKHLQTTPQRILRLAAEAVNAAKEEHPTEVNRIRREAAKKRRHWSTRKLLEETRHVLFALRPCWTMSPVLAAEVLPINLRIFDVVIFDEASQIPPAEAIGSLVRAPQAVIAGDSRQLPPTSFFGASAFGDEEEEDPDDTVALTSDLESLLDLGALMLRDEMLVWHYRSRDDRLIAFSNNTIYGGVLTAFPGPAVADPIVHRLVPFRPITMGGGTRSNPDEVREVVDLILAHARTAPDESLGVITFGQHHANHIENALALRLSKERDASLDAFFSERKEERFFVKNIERVQGDERDAIILSVGYHKDVNGRLPYRFGPLLQEGGERRLNVAITRARSRVTLVSSFSHLDMAPGRSDAKGVELLRQYIEYAASGGTDLGANVIEIPLNPFELSIKDGLERRGIPVTAQFGVSKYRIDFACAHPEERGRMVLAVEADGASYHSSATARDRDRLRQQVLEAKGWRFHRIWSTAWFRDPEAELDKAEAAWKEAVAASDRGEPAPVPAPAPSPPPEIVTPAATRPPRPDVPRRGSAGYDSIMDYRDGQLAALLAWIESDTLLRTEEELQREMMRELGFGRSGKRIDKRLQATIRRARAAKL